MIKINTFNNIPESVKETARLNGCDLKENILLKDYTTFKTGGVCPLVITPHTADGTGAVLKALKSENVRYAVLGNGSNILAPDEGFDGVIIKIADGITDMYLIGEDEIYCGAGVKLVKLCNFALEHSLSGLEFAYGIPGSCGGAVYMNAGAYGGEIKDVIQKAEHIDNSGEPGSFEHDELGLGYRRSVYADNGFIITGAVFKLKKADKTEIKAKMDDLISRRKAKQPLEYPSAGSTFKRPEGYFAGALIEECGLKGYAVGGACVSPKHAGFVINTGSATAEDILKLIEHIKTTVQKEKGVTLEPEVKILR